MVGLLSTENVARTGRFGEDHVAPPSPEAADQMPGVVSPLRRASPAGKRPPPRGAGGGAGEAAARARSAGTRAVRGPRERTTVRRERLSPLNIVVRFHD